MNTPFDQVGKVILVGGLFLVLIGIVLIFFNKIPFLGKLPGDILIKRENFTFYFPLATGIILSIVISLVLFLLRKL